MTWTQRIVNQFRTPSSNGKPRIGRLLQQRPEDAWRDYPSSNLTPTRLMAILREADAGSLSAAMQLYEEMEEKDAHLYAVANTRRLAVTGLNWSILSDAHIHNPANTALADAAAQYARDVLERIDSLDELLQHLALATGRNIAVGELVWDRNADGITLADFVNRHHPGMIQTGRCLGFAIKAPHFLATGQVPGLDHLQGHDSVQPDLSSFVDNSHSPSIDLLQQLVLTKTPEFPRRFAGSFRGRRWMRHVTRFFCIEETRGDVTCGAAVARQCRRTARIRGRGRRRGGAEIGDRPHAIVVDKERLQFVGEIGILIDDSLPIGRLT